MLKLSVFIIAAFIFSYTEGKCQSPPIWEGNVMDYDRRLGFFREARIYYNSELERIRIREPENLNKTRPPIDEFLDYKNKKRFEVDLRNGHCKVSEFHVPFRPFEIPDSAHFIGGVQLGAKDPPIAGTGVQVGIWVLPVENAEVKGNYTLTSTLPQCVPVREVFIGETLGTKHEAIYFNRGIFDVIPGTVTPNAFDPPSSCFP